MSYIAYTPHFYEMFVPGTPFHAGAPGWTQAPFPGWGENPVLRGPRMLTKNGAPAMSGCGCGTQGMGQEAPSPPPPDVAPPTSPKLQLAVGVAITLTLGTLLYFAARPHRRYAPNRRRRARSYRSNAKWSRKYKNTLPDDAFLYVEPGCADYKDEAGRSHPLDCRVFPYKDRAGNVDLPHLRNAIARIPVSAIPASEKPRLQRKARKLLALATGRPYAELEERAARRRRRERALAA